MELGDGGLSLASSARDPHAFARALAGPLRAQN